jgi:hypothetical protein
MDRGDEAKIEQMSACYRRIYESEYEDDEKILLLNFIRTYYQLTPDESTAFDERLGQEVNREVREMEYSYFGKVRQEGRQEGIHLILLELLQVKFGELPPVITDRVRAIESQEELTGLVTKVHNAESLADLGLNGAA